jgi:RND family efflux transporter MFP subunit
MKIEKCKFWSSTEAHSKSILHFAICILSFAPMFLLSGCERSASVGKAGKKEMKEAASPVTVAPVRTQEVQRTVEMVGTLHANEEVTISSELDGRIAAITADLGDRVGPGNVLARIEDTEFRLGVEQSEGSLKETLAKLGIEKVPPPDFDVSQTSLVLKAGAELHDAQVNLKRMKALYDEKVISAQEYDSAETRAKTALATYKSTTDEAKALVAVAHGREAQLGTARKKLRDAMIRAPLAGSVSKRLVSAGEYVKVAAPLFTIVQDHPLKLKGMIPERFSPQVRAGQLVEIRVDPFPETKFKGRLTRIGPSAEVTSRSFVVEGLVENPQRRLKPGFFAKATILTHTDPHALTVPQQALVTFAGVSKLFVVGNGVARERVVQPGVRVGANDVEITGGLKPGELVVIAGLTRLSDGAAVKVSGPVLPKEKRGESK